MSSASEQSNGKHHHIGRSIRLLQDLSGFVVGGDLRDDFVSYRDLFTRVAAEDPENCEPRVLDWFMFDWLDAEGESAIDHFLDSRSDLTGEEQQILLDWEDSIRSVFEVLSSAEDSIGLRHLETGESLVALPADVSTTPKFDPGHFLAARLLPTGRSFLLGRTDQVITDSLAAAIAFDRSRLVEMEGSPEWREHWQREQHAAFCEIFGCDEMEVPFGQVPSALEQLHRRIFFERSGFKTAPWLTCSFFAACTRSAQMLETAARTYPSVREMTLMCDEFDGLVLLPDYNYFKRIFTSETPGEIPGWRELVWAYIKDPNIPLVAFEHLAEQYPERLEQVLRVLLGEPGFSIEHLYAMLLHYKDPVEGLETLEDDERLWDLLNAPAAGESGSEADAAAPAKPAQSAARPRPKTRTIQKTKAKPKAAGNRVQQRQTTKKQAAVAVSPRASGKKTNGTSRKAADKRKRTGKNKE